MQNSALDHDRAAALQCVWDDNVHGLAALLDRGVKLDPTARSPPRCTGVRVTPGVTLRSGKSTVIHEAVFGGHTLLCHALLSKTRSGMALFLLRVAGVNVNEVFTLKPGGKESTALTEACWNKMSRYNVALLLENGANPNLCYPLDRLTVVLPSLGRLMDYNGGERSKEGLAIVELLLCARAGLVLRSEYCDPVCECYCDPLRQAIDSARSGSDHLRLIQLLCSGGASRGPVYELWESRSRPHNVGWDWLDATSDFVTPLHYLDIVAPYRARVLLRAGADLNARLSPNGPSPHSLALDLGLAGRAPPDSTPWLVLLAAKPWSPESHSLFPLLLREQALRAFWTLTLLFRTFLPNDASSEIVYLEMSFLISRSDGEVLCW